MTLLKRVEGIDRTLHILNTVAATISAMIFAFTKPTVAVHFISLLTPNQLAGATTVSIALSAIVMQIVPQGNVKRWVCDHFTHIVVIHSLCMGVVSIATIDYPAVRYYALGICEALVASLYGIALQNFFNGIMSGESLTDFHATTEAASLWGGLLGGVLAMFIALDIETMIMLEVFGMASFGAVDIYLARKIRKQIEAKGNEA